jgi:hypothetical protein
LPSFDRGAKLLLLKPLAKQGKAFADPSKARAKPLPTPQKQGKAFADPSKARQSLCRPLKSQGKAFADPSKAKAKPLPTGQRTAKEAVKLASNSKIKLNGQSPLEPSVPGGQAKRAQQKLLSHKTSALARAGRLSSRQVATG